MSASMSVVINTSQSRPCLVQSSFTYEIPNKATYPGPAHSIFPSLTSLKLTFDKNGPDPLSPPIFLLPTAHSMLPTTFPPIPHPVPSSFPPDIPSQSSSSVISTMSTDTHYIIPTSYP